jgi:hypothetical protein
MDILNQSSLKSDLFKESMYSILKQMTFKAHKSIEPNYFGFDCFAKFGINDDISTVVEFIYVENPNQTVSVSIVNTLISNILKAHKNLLKLKILIITNSELSKSSFKNGTCPNCNFEIWDKKELHALMKEYPLDFYTFTNTLHGLKKYLTNDKISAKAQLNIEMFKEEAEHKRVSLVLGAGVSKEYGGLDLNELTNSLIDYLPADYLDNREAVLDLIGKSTLSTIHFVKENVGIEKYGEALYKSLYGDNKKSIADDKTTLFQVASLIARHKELDSIITFNFDDYLEQILVNNRKVNFKYLYQKEDFLDGSLPIFHVHGFLPKNAVNIADYVNTIILSEDDFFRLYSDNNNWQVAVQLEKYKDNLCLFIGSSLRDYNLKRCLQITKQKYKRHYAIMAKRSVKTLNDMMVINRYYNLFNVEIIWVDSHDQIAPLLEEF